MASTRRKPHGLRVCRSLAHTLAAQSGSQQMQSEWHTLLDMPTLRATSVRYHTSRPTALCSLRHGQSCRLIIATPTSRRVRTRDVQRHLPSRVTCDCTFSRYMGTVALLKEAKATLRQTMAAWHLPATLSSFRLTFVGGQQRVHWGTRALLPARARFHRDTPAISTSAMRI